MIFITAFAGGLIAAGLNVYVTDRLGFGLVSIPHEPGPTPGNVSRNSLFRIGIRDFLLRSPIPAVRAIFCSQWNRLWLSGETITRRLLSLGRANQYDHCTTA
jgi:hypothetical protein